jgi:glucokinase
MAAQYTVGIDLGGTNIKAGVCDRAGWLLIKDSMLTEGDGGVDHVIGRMAGFATDLIQRSGVPRGQVIGLGIGAPGPMSHKEGIIYSAPNLRDWKMVPLRDRMCDATGIPTVLENDANAAAFGEFAAGAGQDVRSLMLFTLGTGVGGGVVIDGKLWRGDFDNAAEVGHTIIVPNGRECPCGQHGCMERYASASAVAERLQEAVAAGEPSSLRPRVLAGEPFDARDVLAARAAGDALAARIWEETCYYLALTITNIQHLFNTELVVLSGGLINAGSVLLETVQRHFEQVSWKIAPDAPRIALATLGTDAGTIGAAALAYEAFGQKA